MPALFERVKVPFIGAAKETDLTKADLVIIDSVLKYLKSNTNCMITLDCDGLDSSIMPAVMAPTPGGLSYIQSIDLIKAISKKANLVAFDLIEFVPQRDRDGTSAFTAARILANVLGCLARK